MKTRSKKPKLKPKSPPRKRKPKLYFDPAGNGGQGKEVLLDAPYYKVKHDQPYPPEVVANLSYKEIKSNGKFLDRLFHGELTKLDHILIPILAVAAFVAGMWLGK